VRKLSEKDVEMNETIEEEEETVDTKESEVKEGAEDPKKLAIRMLKEGKSVEEIMEKTGLPDKVIYGLKGSLARKGELPKEGEEEYGGTPEYEEEEDIFKSPKERLESWFIKELEKKLRNIMGEKTTTLVIETLKDNPDIIWDPQMLRYHIVQINPKVNKYMLDWTLNSLYRRLNELKAVYEHEPTFSIPIEPPQFPDFGFPSEFTLPKQRSGVIPRTRSPNFGYGYTPPSQSPRSDTYMIIALLKELINKLGKSQEEPMVEVPFGESKITVPASQVGIYITMNTIMQELKKLSEKQDKEPMVKVPTEDGRIVEMPASQAAYYVMMQAEKEKRRLLEKSTERIIEKYSPERFLRALEETGIQRTPSPTLDLLHKARQDLNKIAERILNVIEYGMKNQITPQVPVRPRYTKEEREKKMEEVSEAIKEAQEEAQLENDIAELVPYVVSEEKSESTEENE